MESLGRERGQTLVEFALVLPILLLVIFAAVDFARLFLTYLSVSNGAREGARQAIVRPFCLDATGDDPSSIQRKVRAGTEGAVAWAQVTPVVAYYASLVGTPTPITTPSAGSAVRVSVTTLYQPVTPLAGPIIGNPSITAESTMMIDQAAGCLPTSTPTETDTPTATPTVDPSATSTPTPTPTSAATGSPTPTATPCSVPAVPTGVTVAGGSPPSGGNTHTISWSPVTASGVTFHVYRRRHGAASYERISSSALTSSPFTLNEGADHHHNNTYRVTALNSCGESAQSSGDPTH